MLGVPLLRDGRPVGLLSLYRTRVAPFTLRQIELLETFADQAVIAIENTRLFEEVQARTRELTESLEYQTATSGILDIISRTKAEIQPVFDAIVENAARLSYPCTATITTLKDECLHWNGSATLNPASDIRRMQEVYPVPLRSGAGAVGPRHARAANGGDPRRHSDPIRLSLPARFRWRADFAPLLSCPW